MTSPQKHRSIKERWVIQGILTLETPANFGGGEIESPIDISVLRDETDGKPIIPGTSLAGAVRNYLREREVGYFYPNDTEDTERNLYSTLLFGGFSGDDEGDQSPLITFDAFGDSPGFELRDGVKIDGKTRTAAEDHKFDFELLSAGTTFDLRFELIISNRSNKNAYLEYRQKLLNALATGLNGLANGEIHLGARKTRGFGKCSVSEWYVRKYDMADTDTFLAYLSNERNGWTNEVSIVKTSDISKDLDENITLIPDERRKAELHAKFSIDGSLMICSGSAKSPDEPDMVHLTSLRQKKGNENDSPILPGTSWAGILRHRAERIVRTLNENTHNKASFIDDIFGPSKIEEGQSAWASRLVVDESLIEGGHSMIQSRIKIDRFTGGAYEGALFEEQPIFGNRDSLIKLDIVLKFPSKANENNDRSKVGLILLLLKDLWTSDLPVGGKSSIGRGRLKGYYASLKFLGKEWTFTQNLDGKLSVTGNKNELEQFVQDFNERMKQNDGS